MGRWIGRHRVTLAVVAVLAAGAVVWAVQSRPPSTLPLTGEQCDRFADRRVQLVEYTQDDWEAFVERGSAISVQGGVARIVGDLIDDVEELRTTETDAAVERVLQAGYGYARLAGDYAQDPAVPGDADDLADQRAVRDALDRALSTCAPPLDRVGVAPSR